MECYKCSISGKKLYYMDVYYDEELPQTPTLPIHGVMPRFYSFSYEIKR